jgi:hypothetical protein
LVIGIDNKPKQYTLELLGKKASIIGSYHNKEVTDQFDHSDQLAS